jgi:hypothetical protein
MPLNNLFKNCAYYWSFGAVIGEIVLFLSPSLLQAILFVIQILFLPLQPLSTSDSPSFFSLKLEILSVT